MTRGFEDYLTNPAQRSLCLLLLDVSAAEPDEHKEPNLQCNSINQCLKHLERFFRDDPVASRHVQLAIVCVGGSANGAYVALDWRDGSCFHAPVFCEIGHADPEPAARLVLGLIHEGTARLRAAGITYDRPRVVVVSDLKNPRWVEAAQVMAAVETCSLIDTYWVSLNQPVSKIWNDGPPGKHFSFDAQNLIAWLCSMLSMQYRAQFLSRPGYEKLTKIGAGSVASVYQVSRNGVFYAAKIYHRDQPGRTNKIRSMLQNPPIHRQAIHGRSAWPVGCIVDQTTNVCVGLLMPYVHQDETCALWDYINPTNERITATDLGHSAYRILKIAHNLATTLADVHAVGHYCVDLSPHNIRVHLEQQSVTLLDCDGWSINDGLHRYPAEAATQEYMPPEVQRYQIPLAQWGELQDCYVLAVILFQLLNRGIHPFQGVLHEPSEGGTNDEHAARGLYPYGLVPHPQIAPYPLSQHQYWPQSRRALFDRAFGRGDSLNRPSAGEWAQHCLKALQELAHHA